MNRNHNFNTETNEDDPWQVDCTYLAVSNMLPRVMASNTTPSHRATTATEDKVIRDDSRMARDGCNFETTADGDVLVVQPSFDDSTRSKTPTILSQKSAEWQTRSPNGDCKQSDSEDRNPASPQTQSQKPRQQQHRGHARSLSGRFFESTTISDEATEAERSKADNSEFAGRKHRRMQSGDVTNPNHAHRRINSIGQTAAIPRRHHREDSGGLDILSAAAHATKDEMAEAGTASAWDMPRRGHYPPAPIRSAPHPPPPPRGYEGMHPAYAPPHHGPPPPSMGQNPMHPPPHRRMPYPPPPHGSYAQPPYPPSHYHHYSHPPPPHGAPYYPPPPPPPPAHHHPAYSPSRGRYAPPYPHPEAQRKPMYDRPPPSASRPEPTMHSDKHVFERRTPTPPASEWSAEVPTASSTHQGSQTFVTSIAVGEGNKMVPATSHSRTVATNTEEPAVASANKPPSEIGHHRKMSSFSSLGTMLGSNLFAANASSRGTPTKESSGFADKGHHRKASSNVSFLQGIDVGLEVDATFLRNLHASNEAPPLAISAPVPEPSAKLETSDVTARPPSVMSATSPTSDGSTTGSKLAPGGTSKRVRRKCTVEGCANRVVQGGLCISHGAKRKTCKHPGCNKNVKKAGLCSTHGPARKRCEHPGCPKVAVQGGRCISHGAKKKLCSVEECSKQAILGGMCKKHHDQSVAMGQQGKGGKSQYCRPTQEHHSGHTRGLSFFQEISPDAIATLMNPEDKEDQEGRAVW